MGIVNPRILMAWPNWFIVPAMVAFWVVFLALGVQLLNPVTKGN